MRILLTGAFGNVGTETIRELIAAGHEVRAFDLSTKRNQKTAEKFGAQIEVVWGDLRHAEEVRAAAEGCDAVIHDAAIIPPVSETNPDLTHDVNVGGTQNVIAACEAQYSRPRLIFASSVGVFGPCQHKEPPRRASEPVAPSDHYTHSKVRCEEMVREARLDWVILRFSAVVPLEIDGSAEIDFDGFFKTDPNSRIEYVHPADVGLAQVRALDCGEATGKVLLIGGGKDSQIYMRDLNGAIFGAIGIGGFHDSMFGDAPFYTDWLDTEESQRLLQFQRHDFESYIQDFRHRMRWIRRLIWPLRWPIRMYLKRKSAKVVG